MKHTHILSRPALASAKGTTEKDCTPLKESLGICEDDPPVKAL